jgi:transposase
MTHALPAVSPSSPLPDSSYFVGIDVAKAKLDLARSDASALGTFDNDPAGIAQIVQSLSSPVPTLIVLESTGGLERPLLQALLDANLPVALVNPSHVRHFAIGMRKLAKSDAIDARVLADFARLAAPRLSEKRSANQLELDALTTCRRQFTQARSVQTNRRLSTTSKAALKTIDAVLTTLDKQIAKLDQQIRQLIESDQDFSDLDQLLQSVPGIGAVASATLLAELSELGNTDHRRLSALVGVAPYAHDSGTLKGKRSIRGGRPTIRSVLYMVALTAIRCNPVIQAFAQRLEQSGKAKKVQIVACMRKLLGFLNIMVRDHLRWEQLNVVKALAN